MQNMKPAWLTNKNQNRNIFHMWVPCDHKKIIHMKKIYYIFSSTLMVLIFSACTENFEDLNKHPYLLTNESLQQDFNHIGAFFQPILRASLFGRTADRHQIQHNLTHESFIRHLATPTPFVSGINNTTYVITWNTFWSHVYSEVMAPARQVILTAEEGGYDVFAKWAKLLQVVSAARLTAYYGPIIYSNYGSTDQTVYYDSEEDLHNTLFDDLDEILTVLNANKDFTGLTRFDATYNGDINSWIRFANSLRLQLAIRISNVTPELAKEEGEKAINAPGGLILSNADNTIISLYGVQQPHAVICLTWGDTRMSATMESVLIGYEDGRIHKYFEPATDNTVYNDHSDWPYKGIRNGAFLQAKAQRTGYSTITRSIQSVTGGALMTASMIHFMLAEAALRGWAGTETAKYHYEEGVRASFAEWGAAGVEEYLLDDTKLPLDYVDPKAEGDVNSFINRINVTVKWDDAASNEVKLEKIMTQKWIATYLNSVETWVDHRRTGYPKLPYNYRNDSNETWGIVAADDFLRRMPFVSAERTNNPEGVADAVQKLGGPDMINTRLWWDTGGPNF